ncbi:hypothetical protein SAMN03080615_02460 [Amphritea atlantica]|uniref:Uncharacterized protein n=1 Tax=Amphritea atlantica TaxID=355243 RepID=A0A1H9I6H9_9GAMM|nr:hypothetical protein [Amphritea atlantica]SEQ70132.1 hypothetical protein SAMN03080615_02460 [Amphritea atlantica]
MLAFTGLANARRLMGKTSLKRLAMISEADWKHFKTVQAATLDKFCKQILDDASETINDVVLSNHEKYISLYRMIEKRDKRIAEIFNYNSRSKVMLQLYLLKSEGLLEAVQIAGFSTEVQEYLTNNDLYVR